MIWQKQKLGDLCEIYQPITIATKNLVPDGAYNVYGANGIIGKYNSYNHENSELLLTCRGNTCGALNVSTPKSWINGNAMVIRPKSNSLDIKFLKYILEGYIDISNIITGSAQPQITRQSLAPTKIPVPPLSEQQAIVDKLDTAFELIDRAKANIEQNIQNAKELFQCKLNQVFSQKGEGWEEKKLGEIGKVSMCKRIMKDQTLPEGDIPFYKIGTFGKSPNAFISKEIFNEYSTKYSYPKKGEILLSASGTIGRCVVFDGEPSFFQDSNIVWISNNEELVLNQFLFQFYKVCDWNPSKGATISRLYNDDLRRIIINFPTSLEMQKKIVGQIELLSEQTNLLQQKYQQKLDNLEELKKSILEKAFNGGLV